MKSSLVLAAAAIVAIGSVGCTSRPLRSVFYRGAPCGTTLTTPLVGDVTTYSPACGGCGVADCPTCGVTSGTPILGDGSYLRGFLGDPIVLPEPETAE